jgi:hypothetical protein
MPSSQLTEIEKDIARFIGYFYLEKQGKGPFENKRDPYEAACRELRELGFTQIHFTPAKKKFLFRKATRPIITVHVGRPGVLIGFRGANIQALEQYIEKRNLAGIGRVRPRIKIIENRIQEFLESFILTASYDVYNTDYD